jgi:hypothetical protein
MCALITALYMGRFYGMFATRGHAITQQRRAFRIDREPHSMLAIITNVITLDTHELAHVLPETA